MILRNKNLLKKQYSTKTRRCNISQIVKSIIKTEDYKISKLLGDSTVLKFVTKRWVEINDLSSGQYAAKKNVRFKNTVLASDLCDYSDAYIVVKERTSVTGNNNANKRNKKISFKNNAMFRYG